MDGNIQPSSFVNGTHAHRYRDNIHLSPSPEHRWMLGKGFLVHMPLRSRDLPDWLSARTIWLRRDTQSAHGHSTPRSHPSASILRVNRFASEPNARTAIASHVAKHRVARFVSEPLPEATRGDHTQSPIGSRLTASRSTGSTLVYTSLVSCGLECPSNR